MILASGLNMSSVTVLADVRKNARYPEINTEPCYSHTLKIDGYNETPDIVCCCWAWPHNDANRFSDSMFLTVSLVSAPHCVSDLYSTTGNDRSPFNTTRSSFDVPAGTLFVIDPLITHWLSTSDAWINRQARPWIGIQWTVPRTSAVEGARKIVKKYLGKWESKEKIQDRYQSYRPIKP